PAADPRMVGSPRRSHAGRHQRWRRDLEVAGRAIEPTDGLLQRSRAGMGRDARWGVRASNARQRVELEPDATAARPATRCATGDGAATNAGQCIAASNGGAALRRTGRIDNAPETFAAAFVSVTAGWVLTRNAGGDYVIAATADGGYHWSQQLAVPPTSAG